MHSFYLLYETHALVISSINVSHRHACLRKPLLFSFVCTLPCQLGRGFTLMHMHLLAYLEVLIIPIPHNVQIFTEYSVQIYYLWRMCISVLFRPAWHGRVADFLPHLLAFPVYRLTSVCCRYERPRPPSYNPSFCGPQHHETHARRI